jgi:hypothetical protein
MFVNAKAKVGEQYVVLAGGLSYVYFHRLGVPWAPRCLIATRFILLLRRRITCVLCRTLLRGVPNHPWSNNVCSGPAAIRGPQNWSDQ